MVGATGARVSHPSFCLVDTGLLAGLAATAKAETKEAPPSSRFLSRPQERAEQRAPTSRAPRSAPSRPGGPEHGRIEHMLLAGLSVPDRLVLELAQCLRTEGLNDAAEILEHAYDDERGVGVRAHDRRPGSNSPRP